MTLDVRYTCSKIIYTAAVFDRAPSAIAFDGLKVTAMFIACAAYVAAGVCAILDLRFIAINKRRNFIITTVVRKIQKLKMYT